MESNKDTIIEFSLPKLINLTPTPPIPPSERDRWTPIVWELSEGKNIISLQGVTISVNGNGITSFDTNKCTPRSWRDTFEFILDGGTCYLPCKPEFLDIFIKKLPDDVLNALLGGYSEYPIGEYNITKTKGCFTIRKGNRWGRVYSFWDAFPYPIASELDGFDPEPMLLNDFFQAFALLSKELADHNLTHCVLHSGASVISSFILSGKARMMFGHIDEVPPFVIEWAHQTYKGNRFEGSENKREESDYWDLIAAFPSVISTLIPCYGKHMDWKRPSDFKDKEYLHKVLMEEAFYAFLWCYVVPTERYKFSPTTLRYAMPFGTRLAGFFGPQIVGLTINEYKSLVRNELAKVEILDGAIGIPQGERLQRLAGPMEYIVGLKAHPILGRLASLASQTAAGKMGSIWLDEVIEMAPDLKEDEPLAYKRKELTRTSPLFQLVYSSHVNGTIRALITELALLLNAYFIRADGIGVPPGTKIPEGITGEVMGKLRRKASGFQINPDDMLWEGPGETKLLDVLTNMGPHDYNYIYPKKQIISLRSAALRFRGKNWASHIGEVRVVLDKRRLGSKKRIPKTERNIEAFFNQGIKSTPPTKEHLHWLKVMGGGYDYS